MQRFWAVTLGLIAWTLLAAMTWLDVPGESHRDLAFAAAVAGFVVYLVEIGYLVYVRAYYGHASEHGGGSFKYWIFTMVAVCGFGLLVGIGFPDLMRSIGGRLFVETVVFGGIAAGMVITLTGPPHLRRRAPTATPTTPETAAPGFLRTARNLVVWQIIAAAVAVVCFGPVVLLQHGFDVWIDIPACQERCRTHGLSYRRFFATKTSYACVCAGSANERTFHDRATVTGGHSVGAFVLDWLLRAGTSLIVALGWPALLVVLYVTLFKRRSAALDKPP
jgi:hypothetical protein